MSIASVAQAGAFAPSHRRRRAGRRTRTFRCATTSGCSAASSATPCASRRAAGVFDIVERIRQSSIRFHRDNDVGARRELEAILDSLTADQTLMIVRAFSYFSHLANIAEDQHHIRRNRAHVVAGSPPRAGHGGAMPCGARAQAGIDAKTLRAFFDSALVSPVLTAHPTEVRRKSTLDARAGDRRHHRCARADGRTTSRTGGERGAAAPRSADPLAHQHAAPDQAEGARRGRQRPLLLRLHLLPRAAAHLCGARGRAGAPGAAGQGTGARLFPEGRLVDRRRPRRQSLRHRRGAARDDAPAERARARPLSRGIARAGRRTVGRAAR